MAKGGHFLRLSGQLGSFILLRSKAQSKGGLQQMTAQGHMDTTAHKEMYGNFLKLVKYSIAGTVVVLVVMALTLL